jgi:hypothetical protein
MIEKNSVIDLSREELIKQLDQESFRRRGMSARDLMLAYRAGRLENPGEVADLLALAGLLPEDDPLFATAV